MTNKSKGQIIFSSIAFLLIISISTCAQDTLKLNEVQISAYPLVHPDFTHTSAIEFIDKKQITASNDESILRTVNRRPGIRMEERSPGSYRFSIRGSLLRSPFGIRNIKFYLDEFPFTDGGGNTYLNLLDKQSFNSIEIIKGPDGSFFGANTGGAVKINTAAGFLDSASAGINTSFASYNTLYAGAHAVLKKEKYVGNIFFSRFNSDGYRKNSRFERNYFLTSNRFKYSLRNSIGLLLTASKIDYRTPGGITFTQASNDPQQARQASGNLKSAEEQKAGVENTTVFAGIFHDIAFGENGSKGSNKTNLSFSHTKFENPFITNYEVRDENTISLRNTYQNKFFLNGKESQWTIGIEGQQIHADIANYGNRSGEKDTLQASDELYYRQGFLFGGVSVNMTSKLCLEVSGSGNVASVRFRSTSVPDASWDEKNFPIQFMPRLASIYSFNSNLNLRFTLSKGYSLPTLAEIRPSSNTISSSLEPEHGWNAELGIRARNKNGRWSVNLSGFYYKLQNAIVRRIAENDDEYFTNAGGTLQPGVECAVYVELLPMRQATFLHFISLTSSYSYNHFTFSDYILNEKNFSGNKLTGVPENIFTNEINFDFVSDFSLVFDHYYSSKLPLNDGNTVFTEAYNLFDAKIEKRLNFRKFKMILSSGCNNIFNEFYSSGNDLNAAGSRYYNPSPLRNYFVAVKMGF